MTLLARICWPQICSYRHIRTSAVNRLMPRKLRGFISSEHREADFKRRDNVPDHYVLIYRGPMESYVKWSVHLSTFSASISLITAIVARIRGDVVTPMMIDWDLVSEVTDIYYFTIGFIIINLLVRFVVDKIPLRIYRIPDKKASKYLVVYNPQLPLTQSHYQFVQGDARPYTYFFSPWNNITYQLGDKNSFIFMDHFKTPLEFNKLFIKPEDDVTYKVDDDEEEEREKEHKY